ncbi:MAG: LysR family transcriptional regulator [Deltaproteobacteria bacterium]|nr:LysR family transcriptional regulator [Deltaproteobacteria bacterium]
MKVRFKIWIETDDGGLVMGEGSLRILEAIERKGSLSAAARSLGMSYRAVWGKVRRIEKRLGKALVTGKSGGCDHGGAVLTPEARRLAGVFRELDERATEAVVRLAGETDLVFAREGKADPTGGAQAPRRRRRPTSLPSARARNGR